MSPVLAQIPEVILESPIAGVEASAWTAFVRVMRTSPTTAVSPSNALGAFEMTPRRLVDLGILSDALERTRSKKSNRVIWATGRGPERNRAEVFLKSMTAQYRAFSASMVDYASKISSGAVKLPQNCSLSGALAILHRAGVGGLSGARFPATQAAFERTNGIF